jgi:hypothetical protein
MYLEWPNRFWSVSLDLTLFLIFFETFCKDASHHKLRMCTNFIIFGPMDQKLWVFEVFGQGLARAGMCWSQWGGVDTLKKMGQGSKKKEGQPNSSGGTHRVQQATARCILNSLRPVHLKNKIVLLFFLFFWALVCSKGLGFLGGVCIAPPFFEACPYTWKCKILQITWRLEISLFFKFYFF